MIFYSPNLILFDRILNSDVSIPIEESTEQLKENLKAMVLNVSEKSDNKLLHLNILLIKCSLVYKLRRSKMVP